MDAYAQERLVRYQSPTKMKRGDFTKKLKDLKDSPPFCRLQYDKKKTNNYGLLTIQKQNPVEKCDTCAFLRTSGKPCVLPCH